MKKMYIGMLVILLLPVGMQAQIVLPQIATEDDRMHLELLLRDIVALNVARVKAQLESIKATGKEDILNMANDYYTPLGLALCLQNELKLSKTETDKAAQIADLLRGYGAIWVFESWRHHWLSKYGTEHKIVNYIE